MSFEKLVKISEDHGNNYSIIDNKFYLHVEWVHAETRESGTDKIEIKTLSDMYDALGY
ncbi:hypothetical protein [Cognatishimia sp.]|uniref:hypothetical protein n=1 Tax=Cognatishimia sp. TaxID=2211648 RepID=UPI003513FCEB|nr:hypothetical protein [Cognatishimia sp.]